MTPLQKLLMDGHWDKFGFMYCMKGMPFQSAFE